MRELTEGYFLKAGPVRATADRGVLWASGGRAVAMEHCLDVEIQLSDPPRDLAAAEALVRRVAEEAISKTLGRRGRGALTELAVDGSIVRLRLESDGGRPHQVLLALARRLAEELGRSQKIGVRGFRSPATGSPFPWRLRRKRRSRFRSPTSCAGKGTGRCST
ncbi:MAG: hypothetical protein ACYCW9_05030 [Thermoplasmata archaeon]